MKDKKIDFLTALPQLGPNQIIKNYLNLSDFLIVQSVSQNWKRFSLNTVSEITKEQKVIKSLNKKFLCYTNGVLFVVLCNPTVRPENKPYMMLKTSNRRDFHHIPVSIRKDISQKQHSINWIEYLDLYSDSLGNKDSNLII